HAREGSILHRNKKHRVTKNCEERCKKKNDRFNVVPQEGNIFDRHIQPPMNQLPDRLNIVGQVERPILEIRPASVRRPGADQEKQGRERGNDSLARINCLPLSRDHLELPRASSFGWFLFAFGIVGQIVAEGVGFEPTVGCPTLDFESSALNRTQPPFLGPRKTSNAERPTSKAECKPSKIERWPFDVLRFLD